MKTTLTVIATLLTTTPAIAQEATRALVNIIVAEQFCGINAPVELVRYVAGNSMAETGLDNERLSQAGYAAADEIGLAYVKSGYIVQFCQYMRNVYEGME